jgi:serine/threonine protein kinase
MNNNTGQSTSELQKYQKLTDDVYCSQKQIGKGAFGIVYLGKFIKPDKKEVPAAIKTFKVMDKTVEKEIELASRLDHPNIVKIYKGGYSQLIRSHYIALELMEQDLSQFITSQVKNYFSEDEAKIIFHEIAKGIEYLHHQNIIHRDLKLDNILLDKELNIKITDFGLSREVGMSSAASFVGTPAFMSPEYFRLDGNLSYGKEVDIWALGCILFTLTTGKLAVMPPRNLKVGTPEYREYLYKATQKDIPIPNNLSQGLTDLLKQMLNKTSSKRITIDQILEHHWMISLNRALDNQDLLASKAMGESSLMSSVSMKRSAFVLQQAEDETNKITRNIVYKNVMAYTMGIIVSRIKARIEPYVKIFVNSCVYDKESLKDFDHNVKNLYEEFMRFSSLIVLAHLAKLNRIALKSEGDAWNSQTSFSIYDILSKDTQQMITTHRQSVSKLDYSFETVSMTLKQLKAEYTRQYGLIKGSCLFLSEKNKLQEIFSLLVKGIPCPRTFKVKLDVEKMNLDREFKNVPAQLRKQIQIVLGNYLDRGYYIGHLQSMLTFDYSKKIPAEVEQSISKFVEVTVEFDDN